jgi:hypothetical protein
VYTSFCGQVAINRGHLTRMLTARTSFSHLYFGHIRHSTSRFKHSFRVMAHGQTNWKHPSRLTEEPILKVYNTLTRTKVRPFRIPSMFSPIGLLFLAIRTYLLRGTEDVSNGTTADLPYTMHLIWATQGMPPRVSETARQRLLSILGTTLRRTSCVGFCRITLVTTSIL